MVDRPRIELGIEACKATVIPFNYQPIYLYISLQQLESDPFYTDGQTAYSFVPALAVMFFIGADSTLNRFVILRGAGLKAADLKD